MKALLVQLVERRFPKSDVEGSSPSGRVIKKTYTFLCLVDILLC
jgi:hypothetical protein